MKIENLLHVIVFTLKFPSCSSIQLSQCDSTTAQMEMFS